METKKYQLPKEFAEKWVKALRSKKYKQGKYKLCTDHTFCCLGVAGVVAGIDESILENHSTLSKKIATPVLPDVLVGNATDNGLVAYLVSKNDGIFNAQDNPNAEKWGFRKIADYIETNVEFV